MHRPAAREGQLSQYRAIIAAARKARAEAVHPGYGFLSENAAFAQACADAGLVFVGPPAETIRADGIKGTGESAHGRPPACRSCRAITAPIRSAAAMRDAAERIGYPVLIKASAGGGGQGHAARRGGRRVRGQRSQARRARRRPRSATMRVLLEKYIARPRHIEIQVFGDTHGNVVTLFERECSLQRRHQKVVEEAPSPGLTPARRAEMCGCRARGGGRPWATSTRARSSSSPMPDGVLFHRDEHAAAGRASRH